MCRHRRDHIPGDPVRAVPLGARGPLAVGGEEVPQAVLLGLAIGDADGVLAQAGGHGVAVAERPGAEAAGAALGHPAQGQQADGADPAGDPGTVVDPDAGGMITLKLIVPGVGVEATT